VATLYRIRLRNIQLGDGGGQDANAVRDAERDYRLAALGAERDTILQLGRDRAISDDTARKLLREIDLVEARYRDT
jgi:CPA1 family monovalent cation:H+ antiporter